MRKLTPKEAASLCAILGTLAAGCAHAGTQCQFDPNLNGCHIQTVVIQPPIGNVPIPYWSPPTLYIPPNLIGVVGSFTGTSETVGGGTAGAYSSGNNPNCPTPQNPSPQVQTAAIQSDIQGQEGPDPLVEAMQHSAYGYNFNNETAYVPSQSYKNPTTGVTTIEVSPGSGFTIWGVDGGQNSVEGLENNAAPGTLLTVSEIMQ